MMDFWIHPPLPQTPEGPVMALNSHRGHPIEQVTPDDWVYSDTREPVSANPGRKCGHCNRPNRSDGHDACLGVLPGAMNACCGHGNAEAAYVQLDARRAR